MYFPSNSPFQPEPEDEDAPLERRLSDAWSRDLQEKEAQSQSLDQVIYDLNELIEDLRYATYLDEATTREVQQRVEDIRNEVYNSLRG